MKFKLPVCCGQVTIHKHGWECSYAECQICHTQYDQCIDCEQFSDDPCEHGVCYMCTANDLMNMGFKFDLDRTHMHGHHWFMD